MNITLLSPPESTGNTEKDLEELREWCFGFYSSVKRILYNIDSSNINELDAKLVSGTLPLDSVTISGGKVNIAKDSVSITNSDGSHYLKLSGDTLTFCGKVTSL